MKMECNGTGPASRQLQDKVGGVTPAGLSLESSGELNFPTLR
jgi:hypothetical protein